MGQAQTGSLTSKAMLVRLNISQWEGRKFDKKATKEVEAAHHTIGNAGRFNKILIAESAIRKITNINGKSREFHYLNSRPWRDDGARILPSANFLSYTKGMQEFKEQYRESVEELITNYEGLVEEAKTRLNTLYNAADYPSAQCVKNKHAFSVSFDPIPEAGDFRVELSDEAVEEIKKEITDRNNVAFREANKDLWVRLHTSIKHMVDKLSTTDARIFESMLGNIADLCSLLPRLNFEDDKELDRIRLEVEKKLCSYTTDDLRTDRVVRANAAKEAKEILEDITKFMS